jgi:acetoin utilization deacetylase AcuC-like enzyme
MKRKIGIVRDKRYLEHKPGHMHPENPRRIKAVYQMIDTHFKNKLINIEAEAATLEHLELVHTPAYIKKVMKTADHNYTSLAADTPTSSKSYLAAWVAAGGCLKGLDALMTGLCNICFAMVRPPGHHALADRAGGFCIFNNTGITARYARKYYGLKRVLIIDWDIHHGNGLNDLFYDNKEILYFSSHDMLLYPYSGDWKETGKSEGEGYTINLPIPRDLEDREFFYLYHEILGPTIRRYVPELILIDAGFDAHHEDPIGRSRLTEKVYRWLTWFFLEQMSEINNPPMMLVLEGGYHPGSLAKSVKEVLEVLISEEIPESLPISETDRANKMLTKIRRIHKRYGIWTD